MHYLGSLGELRCGIRSCLVHGQMPARHSAQISLGDFIGVQLLYDSVTRMQLAVVSKRTPVWPDVACNSLWLNDERAAAQRARSGLPKKWMAEDWRGDMEIVPRLPLDGPPSMHRCLVWYYYEEACDMQVTHPPQHHLRSARRTLARVSRWDPDIPLHLWAFPFPAIIWKRCALPWSSHAFTILGNVTSVSRGARAISVISFTMLPVFMHLIACAGDEPHELLPSEGPHLAGACWRSNREQHPDARGSPGVED